MSLHSGQLEQRHFPALWKLQQLFSSQFPGSFSFLSSSSLSSLMKLHPGNELISSRQRPRDHCVGFSMQFPCPWYSAQEDGHAVLGFSILVPQSQKCLQAESQVITKLTCLFPFFRGSLQLPVVQHLKTIMHTYIQLFNGGKTGPCQVTPLWLEQRVMLI